MAFELLGIDNENEFYPGAFLTDALEEELKAALARWREAVVGAIETPDVRLSAMRAGYLNALDRVRTASSASEAYGIWRKAAGDLVSALGYAVARDAPPTHDGMLVPVIARCANRDGRDQVWVIEAPMPAKDEAESDPLTQVFASEQFDDADRAQALLDTPIETVLTDAIFAMDAPPRYVIVAGLNQLVLIDRAKWARRSVLRFELSEIFKRAERTTLDAMACLLSREARAPETGVALADRLEEEAQRHANAVTTSLKRTVRDAIEILGNEVLAVTGGKYPTGKRKGVWIESQDLTIECLRYMYRLLFLFYAEANPRLGIIPLNDEIYRKGYSLEALRGLETRKLRTQEEKEGTFLWESLQRLLGLMYEGLDRSQIGGEQMFSLPRVRVSLLDPDSTPILSNIKLRNEAMQRIIRSLSLKQDRAGTGRISYAQLGIGQLGAVYETLISFTGFVAKSDMIELIPPTGRNAAVADDLAAEGDGAEAESAEDDVERSVQDAPEVGRTNIVDPLAPSYFVTRDRAGEFSRDEIVYDGPQPRIYKKGSFVYRLAGRDRQKSASYYTPEPLARLLVKHALLERCRDMSADEALELKILEPAMGSAAFLVETTNQLADIYLERKQDELNRRIPQDQYYEERQKVRAYIADRNCFGVDQNPIAVELGQISLWLNGLHSSEFSPWFGDQLHAGNSLIGARRASYDARLLKPQAAANLWLKQIPTEIGWRGKRDPDHVWQFLLPAADMAKFETDRSITEFAASAQEAIKAWRRGGFFAPLQEHEIKLLLSLSEAVDQLFESVADDLKAARSAANDEITIWPDRVMPGVNNVDFHAKLARLRVLQGDEHVSNSLPYQRLKTVMDAWCALWLWPLDKAELLPSRQEYLLGLQAIVKGGITQSGEIDVAETALITPQGDFLTRLERADRLAKDLPSRTKQSTLFQQTNIDALISTSPWLKVAKEVAARERFAHFELIFADVLRDRGGFDLIVGNPPWSKPSWNEGDVIGDIDPAFVVRNFSAIEMRTRRSAALTASASRDSFLSAYASAKGGMTATGSAVMNPFAGGGQNNLYRCFVDLSFRLCAERGCAALIHQDGHLFDPNAGSFRAQWYRRIRKHFDFTNQIKTHNFAEVLNTKRFSLNIYSSASTEVAFEQFTNAYLAAQIEESYQHDGAGEIPHLKKSGTWDTRGHSQRILRIDSSLLRAGALLLGEGEGRWTEAPLFQFLTIPMQDAFLAIAKSPTIATAAGRYQFEALWHESGAQSAGLIRAQNTWPNAPADLILTGPIMYWGNPMAKTPRDGCRSPRDYEVVHLDQIGDNYLPRTNFVRGDDIAAYRAAAPKCDWDVSKNYLDLYRVMFRRRVDVGSERSFSCAIIQREVSHIDALESAAFERPRDLVTASCLWNASLSDFVIKSLRQTNIRENTVSLLPWLPLDDTAIMRGLQLACLTQPYADLWEQVAANLKPASWSKADARLPSRTAEENKKWVPAVALRTPYSRRMALLEIDVLVAMAAGITLEQLLEIYRASFPILAQNESETWFDSKGQIVWTSNRGLPRIGYLSASGESPSRKDWEALVQGGVERLECDALVDFLPGGPRKVRRIFEGPFDREDRIEDYTRAWGHFEGLRAAGAAA